MDELNVQGDLAQEQMDSRLRNNLKFLQLPPKLLPLLLRMQSYSWNSYS
jgi:hypothetical protein